MQRCLFDPPPSDLAEADKRAKAFCDAAEVWEVEDLSNLSFGRWAFSAQGNRQEPDGYGETPMDAVTNGIEWLEEE